MAVNDPYRQMIESAFEAVDRINQNQALKETADRLKASAEALTEHLAKSVRNQGGIVELHCFGDRGLTDYERKFFGAAKRMQVDGEIEFDEESFMISGSSDAGEYVLGWVWIDDELVEEDNEN